jgi:hypothetical protein
MLEEPLSNRMEMISRGNSKSINYNPQIAKKTINKEDRYSHVIPLDILICLLLPHLRHTTQTMVIKEDKNSHLCYNASVRGSFTTCISTHVLTLVLKEPLTKV